MKDFCNKIPIFDIAEVKLKAVQDMLPKSRMAIRVRMVNRTHLFIKG
jgi:hypothetical protein